MVKSDSARFRGRRPADENDDEDSGPASASLSCVIKAKIADVCIWIMAALLVMCAILLMVALHFNRHGDIGTWYSVAKVSKDVFKIDQVYEIPHSKGQFRARAEARESLDDNFLDTLMAVDYIERAIGHGNLAGAQEVLNKVTAYLGEKESEDVQRLIDNAVAENPIVDALACHANQVLELVKETGGSIATHKDEAGNETHAVLIADFESVAESRDGRGRGLAALRVFAPGETVLEVAHAAHMSWRSASKAGDGLGEILSAEASTAGGVLQSFNGLVLFLLHQAHTAASPYRKYICSLPLHVPLPLLWADEDLPDSFLSDPKLMAERLVARELVATSYNVTVPVMLAKYPAVFSEEMLLEHKWSWACSIVLSRALAMRASDPAGTFSNAAPETLAPAVLLEALKNPASEDRSVFHALVPVVDMMNHEAGDESRSEMLVEADGRVVVKAGDAGLKQGWEVAREYSDKFCGNGPLQQWGFVVETPCPGDEDSAGQESLEHGKGVGKSE